jgi:archaellum component FlaF (FlaF/FlaG flagellin family)
VCIYFLTVGIIYSRAGSSVNVTVNILFGGENISFDACLTMYINSTNIPPIIIMNRMYENQNLLYIFPLTKHTIVVRINPMAYSSQWKRL